MLCVMHMKEYVYSPLTGCVLILKMLAINSESKGISCFWVCFTAVSEVIRCAEVTFQLLWRVH